MSYIKSIVAPVIVGTSLSLSSCDGECKSLTEQSRRQVLSEIMADKPVKEYDAIINTSSIKPVFIKESQTQSSLDSVAYRNVFEGTSLAKDSAAVKTFNRIAADTRPNIKYNENQADIYNTISDSLDNKTKDLGITKKSFDANQKEYNKITEWRSSGITTRMEPMRDKIIATKQFKADSMAYEKFFKDNGILTDNLKKQLKSVAKKVKP